MVTPFCFERIELRADECERQVSRLDAFLIQSHPLVRSEIPLFYLPLALLRFSYTPRRHRRTTAAAPHRRVAGAAQRGAAVDEKHQHQSTWSSDQRRFFSSPVPSFSLRSLAASAAAIFFRAAITSHFPSLSPFYTSRYISIILHTTIHIQYRNR